MKFNVILMLSLSMYENENFTRNPEGYELHIIHPL